MLITGRGLDQFNAGTMTRHSVTQRLDPTDAIEISPADANSLGNSTGNNVRISSRYGKSHCPHE